ncbi:M20/M25/M40 family metallo-hydrolase [Acidimangrovimonas sediminis]|uniref:M20/M25/M40 family metallo-hydrolase n=1 Tax=Acidimangrovimonas sediminis TaxID=2056283 RepID=UPI000C7FAD95|nr:M20/M25/M40 family metallo-hydrolase [Acidimangrovimonas sediminis]
MPGPGCICPPAATPGFANLIAHFGDEREGGTLWAGHLDVVPAEAAEWAGDPFTLRRDGARLIGRGTTDMKGFLACVLAVAEAGQPGSPQSVAITFDEETTMAGAALLPAQCAALGIRPGLVIVGEPTDLHPCSAHPGVVDMESLFIGRAGHGADRRDTLSAIEAASHFVCDMSGALPETARFNAGVIAGGTARNVVAGSCTLSWELRFEDQASPEALIEAA